jgi:Ca-activated chloride channel homolog
MPTPITEARSDARAAGGRLVAADGRTLPLSKVTLAAEAAGGLARCTLIQSFRNPWDEPLQVSYCVPLPVDGAVSGFRMTMDDTVVSGRIESREMARDQYERAMCEGRTAGLLDQERSNIFTLQVGNVPAGARVETELVVDQRLAWLADGDGGWEWRFPTVVAPRYLGAPGRTPDAGRVEVDVAGGPLPAVMSLHLSIGDDLARTAGPVSPSHAIRVDGGAIALEGAAARLDRDVVVRWGAARPEPGMGLRTCRPRGAARPGQAFGLLTIVPPSSPAGTVSRDLILLLDTSGSMRGLPLEQSRLVAGLLIDSLTERDCLEMISFDVQARRWRQEPVPAGGASRREAHAWLAALEAGGGTEMTSGLEEALRPLRPQSQRQVVMVTDGMIGFEAEIIAMLRDRLPRGSRLHTVGVGPAVNRALTGPAARAGRGAEVLLGLSESPEAAGRRLVAATKAPALVDVALEGSALAGQPPRSLPDVMAGQPGVAAVRLRPEGGDLTVTARGPEGPWRHTLHVAPVAPGEGSPGIAALYAREAVEDLEMDLAAGGDRDEIDAEVLRLGLEFGIATRLTSWVAVSEHRSVDPLGPFRTVRIPQELPAGLSAEGLGLCGREAWPSACLREDESELVHLGITTLGLERLSSLMPKPVLKARWLPRVHGDGIALLEMTVEEGEFEWEPAGQIMFPRPDGTIVTASIVPGHSTRRASLGRGRSFRVALDLKEDLPADGLIMLLQTGSQIVVAAF